MAAPISDIQTPDVDSHRGCVLIVSNKVAKESKTHVSYANKMKNLWINEIGCALFDGEIHKDVDCRSMKHLFRDLATADTSQFAHLVVIVIADGGLMKSRSGLGDSKPRHRVGRLIKWVADRLPTNRTFSQYILGSDGRKLSEEEMFSYFFNDKSSWKNKPKLFLLCYPRLGELVMDQRSLDIAHVNNDTRRNRPSSEQHRTMLCTANRSYPTISDFVLMYGTSSYLVDAINNVFSIHWRAKGVLEILAMVNRLMRTDDDQQRISIFESSLAQTYYLVSRQGTGTETEEADPTVEHLPEEIDTLLNSIRREEYRENAQLLRTNVLAILAQLAENPASLNRVRQVDRQIQARTHSMFRKASKGCALIICNALSATSDYHRTDKRLMETLWVETLGCDLHKSKSHENKKASEMKSLIQEFSSIDTKNYEYAVVVISAHGCLEKKRIGHGHAPFRPHVSCPHFLGKDDKPIDEREILSFFNDDSTWSGKVKIFILDYCRGERVDYGVSKAAPFRYEEEDEDEDDEIPYQVNENIWPPTISSMVKDSFLVYAAHAKYIAYANRLIGAVKEVFIANWRTKSITEMLTLVNQRLKTSPERLKAMSLFKSTVTKDFYLYESP